MATKTVDQQVVTAKGGRVVPFAALRLVAKAPQKPAISVGTIALLQVLLNEAMAGKVIGVAVATIERGPDGLRYSTEAAGECYRQPTFARGALATLADQLAELVHSGRDQCWTPPARP